MDYIKEITDNVIYAITPQQEQEMIDIAKDEQSAIFKLQERIDSRVSSLHSLLNCNVKERAAVIYNVAVMLSAYAMALAYEADKIEDDA
jgi:predicted LPLAT superfamily acyltransferase